MAGLMLGSRHLTEVEQAVELMLNAVAEYEVVARRPGLTDLEWPLDLAISWSEADEFPEFVGLRRAAANLRTILTSPKMAAQPRT